MTAPFGLRVDGLDAYEQSVRAAGPAFTTELEHGLNDTTKLVAERAQRRVPVLTGRLRASIKAHTTRREGQVLMGSAAAPYAGWIEYGGAVGRSHSVMRPRVADGRYLMPSFSEREAEVTALCERVLSDTARHAGLD